MRSETRRILAFLSVCIGILALLAHARSQNVDPQAPGVANALKLVAALNLYAQDWDETYPPMTSQPVFQTALTNYVPNPAVFLCPITHAPYLPNPALSGLSLASITDFGSTPAVSAAIPHKAPLIAYLDSHVQQGKLDLTDPTQETVQNAQRVVRGLLAYTQDWDEVFPPSATAADLKASLAPYVRDTHAFICPLSGKPFRLNPQLAGKTVATVPDYSATPALWDQPAKPNSHTVIGFLDLYVERGGVDLTDPIAEGNQHLHSLLLSLDLYTQDYDEVLPPTQNATVFQQALTPYVRSSRVFLSPFSQQPYTPNGALSGQPFASFPDLSQVFAVEDPAPGPGKKITIGYLDGAVLRGGVDQGDPTFETTMHARQLMLGLQEYLQDHDGALPPMGSFQKFKTALLPYVRNSRAFTCPYTHTLFTVNTALNGHNQGDFSDPSTVIVIRDPRPERDGRPTVGYLDGHVTPRRFIPHL